MKTLRIRIFKGKQAEPETTVSVPLNMVKVAARILPKATAAKLTEHGVDLAGLSELMSAANAVGKIVEIEDHANKQKFVISIEE